MATGQTGRPIRVGIVGAGSIAQSGHIPGYRKAGALVAAIADADRERAAQVAADLPGDERGAPRVYDRMDVMLAEESLDAVSICTPNVSHASLAVKALEAGVDVLLEKPMSVDVGGAEAVVAAEAASGHRVLVGMTHRFRQDVEALHRVLASGALGRVYHAHARLIARRGIPRGWFRDRALAGGGALWDTGVHVLDLVWFLLGWPEPAEILGHVTQGLMPDDVDFVNPWRGQMPGRVGAQQSTVEDFAAALVRFRDGSSLSFEVAWAANIEADPGIRLEIFGTEGGIMLPPPRVFGRLHRVLASTTLEVGPGEPFPAEVAHFVEVVRREAAPRCTAEEGARVVRLLSLIEESSRTAQAIAW
jgi:predicted dehydrogenase